MNVFSSLQRRARARIIRKRATKRDRERENRQKKHQCSIFPIHNHIMLFSAEQSNWAVQYRCKTYGMEHHQIDWWYQFVTSRKTKANTNIAKHWSSIELRERERTMFDSFFLAFTCSFVYILAVVVVIGVVSLFLSLSVPIEMCACVFHGQLCNFLQMEKRH